MARCRRLKVAIRGADTTVQTVQMFLARCMPPPVDEEVVAAAIASPDNSALTAVLTAFARYYPELFQTRSVESALVASIGDGSNIRKS